MGSREKKKRPSSDHEVAMENWTTQSVSNGSCNGGLDFLDRIRTGYGVTRSGDVKFDDSSHGEW